MTAPTLTLQSEDPSDLTVALAGDWLLSEPAPGADELLERLRDTPVPKRVTYADAGLGDWDTRLVTTLLKIRRETETKNIELDESALPEGVRQLMRLATVTKPPQGAARKRENVPFLTELGQHTVAMFVGCNSLIVFMGQLVQSCGRWIRGEARYIRSDLVQYIQEAGAESLPIVGLISFLIGAIFAFVGIIQLEQFGAGIYTANLVGVAMVREMAPIMTAIVMAGRIGAAYAAQIGTMRVNEEIDALTTLGLNPMDFLVTPRVIALVVMMPLLTAYASALGVAGGLAVSLVMLDISLIQYVQQTISAVGLNSVFGGLFKCVVYGALVAISGCQQGMASGSSALAVGQATTSAVVQSIILIVVSASVLTVIYINLGI